MPEPTLDEMHENYIHAWRHAAMLREGGCWAEVGPWFVMDAGIGDSSFNVGVLQREPDDPGRALKEAEAWFDSRGLSARRFDLRADKDAAVVDAALAAGYSRRFTAPALSLYPLPCRWPDVPALDWRIVRTEDDVAAYVELEAEEHDDRAFQAGITRAAMRLPGCALVLGAVDARPVARAMTILTGRIGGIHNVYVPPSQRSRGYGAAITAVAVEAGRQLGAGAACLEATELGLPVYERLGFKRRFDYVILGTRPPR